MNFTRITAALAAGMMLTGLAACADDHRADSTPSNPPGTAMTRAFDRAAGTNASGAYPMQSNSAASNPPGTAVGRAFDRAAGTNTSGAYPMNNTKTGY